MLGLAHNRHSGESQPAREAEEENHEDRIGEGSGFRAAGASWRPAFAGTT